MALEVKYPRVKQNQKFSFLISFFSELIVYRVNFLARF